MRIEILSKNTPPEYYIHLKYEGNEWNMLYTLYHTNSLKLARTDYGFGFSKLNYYQYSQSSKTLTQYIDSIGNASTIEPVAGLDDINREAFINGKINLAIFRVQPAKSGITHIRIPRMLTIAEYRQYSAAIIKAYSAIFDVPAIIEIQILGDV
ncbi:MAG: hypothetical protein QXL94_05190 [Candidatus Parvarchaeum sp.]